jgi:hypothetical protein
LAQFLFAAMNEGNGFIMPCLPVATRAYPPPKNPVEYNGEIEWRSALQFLLLSWGRLSTCFETILGIKINRLDELMFSPHDP